MLGKVLPESLSQHKKLLKQHFEASLKSKRSYTYLLSMHRKMQEKNSTCSLQTPLCFMLKGNAMENYSSKVNKGIWVILNLQFEQVVTTEEHIKMFEYNYNNNSITTKIM